jgi:thiamine biosynthesis protein ThiI
MKGKNRKSFENRLVRNIQTKILPLEVNPQRDFGLIAFDLPWGCKVQEMTHTLERIPGIAYFSFARKVPLDIELIRTRITDLLVGRSFETFKIDTRRHDKRFHINSMEMNVLIGDIVRVATGKKAKMDSPDLRVKIEITDKYAYISFEDIRGVGGLPVNPKQKVLAMLSGGIDSPVAAFMMMKRGCTVRLVHFHNQNQMSQSVENKIIQLSEWLARYQMDTELYIVPFERIQKEIIMNVHSTMRMLAYRRFMIKISSHIAERTGARFLIVGDSLSQVASQTLENLSATYYDTQIPILSPLIGLNKNEITALAKKIGTYEISILPYSDCCTFFVPKHPVLRSTAKELEEIESRFNTKSLIEATMKTVKVLNW